MVERLHHLVVELERRLSFLFETPSWVVTHYESIVTSLDSSETDGLLYIDLERTNVRVIPPEFQEQLLRFES